MVGKKTVHVSAELDKELFLRAADALEFKAHQEAGLSMMPDLINEEDTQEWKDAQVIRAALAQGVLP